MKLIVKKNNKKTKKKKPGYVLTAQCCGCKGDYFPKTSYKFVESDEKEVEYLKHIIEHFDAAVKSENDYADDNLRNTVYETVLSKYDVEDDEYHDLEYILEQLIPHDPMGQSSASLDYFEVHYIDENGTDHKVTWE
jgi:hypothetical protein